VLQQQHSKQQQGLAADGKGAVQPEEQTDATPAEPTAAAVDLASLLSRLDAFESELSTRLQRSLGASGALLSRAEGLAADAAAVAGSLEGRVGPLLGSAAALEAQVSGHLLCVCYDIVAHSTAAKWLFLQCVCNLLDEYSVAGVHG
jgi:hypothetical protein